MPLQVQTVATLSDVVLRFASTPERIEILNGLLQYRKALYSVGIVAGFQWLDGSFLEDVETTRKTPPKDIDVTTFFYIPAGKTEQEIFKDIPNLCHPTESKRLYQVDAYLIPQQLGFCMQMSHYWYGVRGTDERLADSIVNTNERVLKQTTVFLALLAENQVVCGLVFGNRSFAFRDDAEVQRARQRLQNDNSTARRSNRSYDARLTTSIDTKRCLL